MSQWQRVRLGDVMTLDVEVVEVDARLTYPVVGVLNRGRGLLYRDAISGAATKYRTLNIIRPGQVVYSRLKAFEGAITVVPDGLDEACASQEFPTFACGAHLLPSYFALLTTTQALWDDLQNLSTGMGGRRERVKPADFLRLRLDLPPLDEQRRIVDLIAAVDAQIKALEREDASLITLRRSTLAELQGVADEAPRLTLGDLIEREGGSIKTGPFGTALKAEEYTSEGVPVISTGEVRQGHLRPHHKTPRVGTAVLARLPTYVLEHGDIVFARKGAVDRSAWVKPSEAGFFLGSDGIRVRLGGDPERSRFVGYLLQTREVIDWLEIHATGTIMKGLNQRVLAAIPIGVPADGLRHDFVSRLDALDGLRDDLARELNGLRAFRTTLLTALVSQGCSIPESYDALLEVA